ncbi:TIGR00159 family protein [Anoxybacterium hadale]|uniref:TIGR00159 family protein n=1 Tax=Anoxybacterium hadale TaxID=3408580 RepID=A0ACD1ADM4_9FIRM|nr:TIGR00159 family protein [Clostridiales bacterium]
MSEIFNSIISGVGITDVIDVAIVAFVIYKVLGFIRETRALQLVRGLLVLVLITILSEQFNFYTLNWILRNTLQLGVIALVIVFQPELRRALEYVGRSKFITPQFAQMDKERVKVLTAAIIKAVDYFSTNKIGALIIMERETTLNDIAETGTKVNAEISTELLGNLFYEGAPLHDGAVIVRGDRVLAAGCVLPLTQSKTLSKDLGTRHRAGIGITENSDAISIIVSEETGIISIAVDGKLSRFLDIKTVEKTLLNIYLTQIPAEKVKVPFIDKIRRRRNAE